MQYSIVIFIHSSFDSYLTVRARGLPTGSQAPAGARRTLERRVLLRPRMVAYLEFVHHSRVGVSRVGVSRIGVSRVGVSAGGEFTATRWICTRAAGSLASVAGPPPGMATWLRSHA